MVERVSCEYLVKGLDIDIGEHRTYGKEVQ